MRAVVVGAGPAGTRCAEQLARSGASVTLVGDEPALPYNRVALSKFLAGDIGEAALVSHDAAALEGLAIRYRSGVRAGGIDRAARRVVVGDEALDYDALVLATGSQAFRLTLPGADLPGVLMYRSLDDVRRMLAAAEAGGAAVVIGGGLLGLEAAAGLARRGMAVTVLHAVDRLMERQLDHGAAAMLARRLAQLGIATALSAKTAAIEGGAQVTGVRLGDGTVIPARLVVMAVGIRPDVALARDAGVAIGRGVVVDDSMRTSDPAIWAIGECAEHRGRCCGLVAPALAQAAIAARVIAGGIAVYQDPVDATALKVAGADVWSAGDIDAPAEAIVLDDRDGFQYRRLLLRDDVLVAATLFGEIADAPWYQGLIAAAAPLGSLRDTLVFGQGYGG